MRDLWSSLSAYSDAIDPDNVLADAIGDRAALAVDTL
jgi:hypothetical protein